MDLDSAPSAVAVPHTFTLRNRSTVAAQTSVRHDSRIALRDTLINRNKSWTLLRNHYKKRHPMRGPMRAPCARTRFYLDSDRASCFETSGLYWRCRILPPPSSLPRLPPPSSFYQPNPMLQTMRAVNSMALGFRPLPPPFSLLSLPPPPSLLLLPA